MVKVQCLEKHQAQVTGRVYSRPKWGQGEERSSRRVVQVRTEFCLRPATSAFLTAPPASLPPSQGALPHLSQPATTPSAAPLSLQSHGQKLPVVRFRNAADRNTSGRCLLGMEPTGKPMRKLLVALYRSWSWAPTTPRVVTGCVLFLALSLVLLR
jgi:hypothetical protein